VIALRLGELAFEAGIALITALPGRDDELQPP
jgi:hypothetical protein